MKEIKKQKKTEEIFSKHYDNPHNRIFLSDLPDGILPTDEIDIQRDFEGYHSENESYDSFCRLVILRDREETDAEFNKRIKEDQEFSIELRQRRLENYLKLKKEFDPE
ncbi:MAG: hypothetical protein WC554_14220 [Clostridia bacterium]